MKADAQTVVHASGWNLTTSSRYRVGEVALLEISRGHVSSATEKKAQLSGRIFANVADFPPAPCQPGIT